MKHRLQRLCALFITLTTLFAIAPATAYAANAPVTAKNLPDKSTTTTIMSKATPVKKGATKVTVPQKGGWIKFKSTKTKAYTFTFTSAKPAKGSVYVVGGQFSKISTASFKIAKIKTDESKTKYRNYFVFADAKTAKDCAGSRMTYEGKKYRYLAKRTCKIKINKGSTIYLSFAAVDGNNKAAKGSFTLTIK